MGDLSPKNGEFNGSLQAVRRAPRVAKPTVSARSKTAAKQQTTAAPKKRRKPTRGPGGKFVKKS